MPSEISHVVHGRRFLKLHPEYNATEFLSGTVFPDIRVLGVIDRSRTHPGKPGLSDVLALKNSWRAGFTFHRYLDLQWDQWVRGYTIEPTYDVWRPFSNAVKLLSDVVLYDELNDTQDLAAWLWPSRDEERLFGVKEADIKLWHAIIAGYLMVGPTHEALRKLLLAQHNPEIWVDEVMGYLRYIEATSKWPARVREFSPRYE